MNELKQALRQAVEALSGMLEVHGVRQSDLRGGADVPSTWVELSDYARSAVAAVEAALAQPEPEPVAWQHMRPLCGNDGELIGYGGREDGRGLDHWPTRALYASAPTQSAELVAVTAERDEARRTVKMAHEAGAQMAAECARLRADLAAMTADRDSWMRQASDRLDDAVKFGTERDQLRKWKQSRMAVEAEWNPQAVANLLGIWPGRSIRACIMPAVQRLIAERDGLMEQVRDEMDANHELRALGGAASDEDMGTFLRRVISERDQFRAEVDRWRSGRYDDLRAALKELRDRIRAHPAYADLTEDGEIEAGGDTAELSYLARVANAALDDAQAGERAHGISEAATTTSAPSAPADQR